MIFCTERSGSRRASLYFLAARTQHSSILRRFGRVSQISLLAATTIAFILTSGVADAHSELVASSPAAGAVLGESPDEIELVFVKGVEPEYGEVTVTGPDGIRYDVPSSFTSGDNVARIDVLPGAVPGHYTVTFQVVTTEGHVLGDGFTYRLSRRAIDPGSPPPKQGDAVPQAPTAASTNPVSGTPSEDGGATLGIGVAVTLVVVVSIVAAIRRRSQ